DEAVIHTGIEIDHAGNALETDNDLQHEDDDELTINEVYEALDEEQRNVVNYLIGVALEDATKEAAAKSAKHSYNSANGGDLTHQEGSGSHMPRNDCDTPNNEHTEPSTHTPP